MNTTNNDNKSKVAIAWYDGSYNYLFELAKQKGFKDFSISPNKNAFNSTFTMVVWETMPTQGE